MVIVTIRFHLKLPFFEYACIYLNFKHSYTELAIPYMSLKLSRLMSSLSYSIYRKNGHWFFKNCHSMYGKISKLCQHAYSLTCQNM